MSRADELYAAITARAAAAAGDTPRRRRQPRSDTPDPLGPLLTLLQAPDPDYPCGEDGCTDAAYVELLEGSGDAWTGYCGRHARRRHTARMCLVRAIPPVP